MTGFNMPPGVSPRDIPGFNCDEICAVCGKDAGDCICPECYMPGCCHAQGDPRCYEAGHLEFTPEQIAARDAMFAQRTADVEADNAFWDEFAREMMEGPAGRVVP